MAPELLEDQDHLKHLDSFESQNDETDRLHESSLMVSVRSIDLRPVQALMRNTNAKNTHDSTRLAALTNSQAEATNNLQPLQPLLRTNYPLIKQRGFSQNLFNTTNKLNSIAKISMSPMKPTPTDRIRYRQKQPCR